MPICRPVTLTLLVRVLLLGHLLLAVPALAQQGDDGEEPHYDDASDVLDPGGVADEGPREGVEEIVVTANKRAEALQDVAISMAALSSNTLLEAGITQFDQIQNFVPNLQILPTTDTRSTSIRIRGIGSVGNNAGIDPSVGIFIDGVYQGRAGMSVGDLFDMERVEVLRGPQGTLYGKNTAAGAINILTKRPSYEWETFAEGIFGDYDRTEVRGSINIPLIEDLAAFRFAGFYQSRAGWDLNRYDMQRVNDANKWGIRSKLAFDIGNSFTLLFSGDYASEDSKSFVGDIITWSSGIAPSNPGGPTATGINFLNISDTTGVPLPPADPYDNVVGANTTPRNSVSVGGVSMDALWEVGEYNLRWLSAWRTYATDSQFDGDFSEYDAVVAWQQVDLNQFSSEFTATSPRWDRFEYQAGAYFYYMSMETVDRNGWQQGLYDTANSFGSQSQQRLLFGLFPPPVFNVNTNEHKTLSVASYGEFTYTILEDLFFTGGLRVTYEEKSRQGVSETHPPVPIDAPPILGPTVFRDEERSTTNVTGRLVLKWFPVDDIMTYASFANGFKSGGFNQLRVSTTESSEFDDEKVLTYELGTRTAWFENRLIANLTGYFTDYDDFQSQVFTGTAINVRNAGRMFSYGFEGDLALTPDLPDYLGNLTMDARVGLNIAEYDEFLVAENTIQGQWDITQRNQPANVPVLACGPQVLPAVGGLNCSRNLSGQVLDNAPRWTFTASLTYEQQIADLPLLGFVRVDYAYTSGSYLAQDLDPHLYQPGYNLLNLRGGLRAEDDLWDITLWMNNVIDSNYLVAGFDVPIISGFAGVKAPPRYYGITVRLRF
jgi:iron complex outermembrane receptor protein